MRIINQTHDNCKFATGMAMAHLSPRAHSQIKAAVDYTEAVFPPGGLYGTTLTGALVVAS